MDENEQPTQPLNPVTPEQHPAIGDGWHETPGQPAYAAAAPANAAGEPGAAQSTSGPGTSWLHRNVVGLAIAAAVLAVIVIAGGTAWGVSAAVAGTQASAPASLNSAHAAAKKAAGQHAAKSAKTAHKRKAHGAVGTIASISGDTWRLHAASGATVTVKIDSATQFGTKKAPAARSSFAVGDRVGVLGTRSGDTVTAKRIAHLPLKARSSATPAPSPSA